jgi:hypothetical protein
MDRLPNDLLADILRRLPARGVASCRTVCKGWRAAVDAREMLLAVARLVPQPMRGFFHNYFGGSHSYFNSRGPTESPRIAAGFMAPMVRYGEGTLVDHRNGLLLYVAGPHDVRVQPRNTTVGGAPSPRRFGGASRTSSSTPSCPLTMRCSCSIRRHGGNTTS